MSTLAAPDEEDSALDFTNTRNAVGHTCEKCQAEIDSHESLVCRRCGWYASIGSFVEIDQSWENNTADQVEETESFKLPHWAWTMITCVVAVLGESIAARFVTQPESAARTMWSVGQLFLGLTVVVVCHFTAFVMYMREVSEAGLLDILLKPLKPWIMRIHELPAYQWLCHGAVSGLVAIVMSLTVIGAIPYERLWDWGFEKPVKQNLMGAVMSQVQQGEGEKKPLEEAVQDLAGKAELAEGNKESPEPKARQHEDCLIIGYRSNAEGLVYTLLLAAENAGSLHYAGQVTPQLSVKQLRDLTDQLTTSEADAPFIKLVMDGVTWVKPKFTCRVNYERKGKKGGLMDVKFESLLSEIDTAAAK
jgi:hypothetical protein